MNKQKALRLATIFLLSSILVWPFYLLGQIRQVTADASITAAEVKVVSSDVTGVEFTLETAAFSQSSAGDIEVVGLEERLSRPGAPALPYFATMLILPPEADVSVSVMEAAVSSSQVARIPPMPQPDLSALDTVDDGLSPYAVVDEAGETMEYALPSLVAVEDAAVYEQNALYPDGLDARCGFRVAA
jgi:hypothetical protein